MIFYRTQWIVIISLINFLSFASLRASLEDSIEQARPNREFLQAVERDCVELVQKLREQGADIQARGGTSGDSDLHVAVSKKDIDMISHLVNLGADINAKNWLGNRPLHYAAYNGDVATIRFLINKKAEIHARNNDHLTPLDCAVEANSIEAVKYLEKQGADIFGAQTCYSKFIPLEQALFYGHIEIFKYIGNLTCWNGATKKGSHKRTLLHIAAERAHISNCCNVEIASYLVEKKIVGINDRDHIGRTALAFAVFKKNVALVRYLLAHGADATSVNLHRSLAGKPVLSVFDALKPEIKQELEDALEQESEQKQEEQVRPLKRQIIEAYEQFLHGDHNDLRNLLLVLPHVMRKRTKGDDVFINAISGAMLNIFKKESIKPLLYFLAETRWQRKIADALLASMSTEWTSDQVSLEQIASEFIVEECPKAQHVRM